MVSNHMVELAEKANLLGISVIKNEQDIVEPFVRHNLRFLDRLIVLDNGSVDNTAEILRHLQNEFPSLVVEHDDQFGHAQQQRMNQLLQEGQNKYRPDFAIPLDADEFLAARDRRALCV